MAAAPPPGTPAPSAAAQAAATQAAGEDTLSRIVVLFQPKAKAVQYGATAVSLSIQLRKMIAQFSFEASPSESAVLVERGVRPTTKAIREAVWAAKLKWPWKNGSDRQMVMRARRDYLAGVFDGVAIEGGAHPHEHHHHHSPTMRAGMKPGPKPKYEHLEQELGLWLENVMPNRQTGRQLVLRRALELDPTFFDHHQANTPQLLRAFMLRSSSWYYHGFKRRQNIATVSIASVGRGLPEDAMERWDRFAERCLAARTNDDGSLVPPSRTGAIDQIPITRIIVGRTTLKKKGSTLRAKVKTCGHEKERYTATPLLVGAGPHGPNWGVLTFHGAQPKPGKKVKSSP